MGPEMQIIKFLSMICNFEKSNFLRLLTVVGHISNDPVQLLFWRVIDHC